MRSRCFLTPHEARNQALPRVHTEYVVFADNDLCYEPGWLEALENNASRNRADVVAPLICIGPPAAVEVHHAGGDLVWRQREGKRYLDEVHRGAGTLLDAASAPQWPVANGEIEFHCVMVRTAILRDGVQLDDRLLAAEHIDFALQCQLQNRVITFEQRAVVTYQAKRFFRVRDLDYFFFRWDISRCRRSLVLLRSFWGIDIKNPVRVSRWVRHHRRRVVVTVFPEALRTRLSLQLLSQLLWPLEALCRVRTHVLRMMHKPGPHHRIENQYPARDQHLLEALWAHFPDEVSSPSEVVEDCRNGVLASAHR